MVCNVCHFTFRVFIVLLASRQDTIGMLFEHGVIARYTECPMCHRQVEINRETLQFTCQWTLPSGQTCEKVQISTEWQKRHLVCVVEAEIGRHSVHDSAVAKDVISATKLHNEGTFLFSTHHRLSRDMHQLVHQNVCSAWWGWKNCRDWWGEIREKEIQ